MSEQISVGDLVVVVRGTACCKYNNAIGSVFTVSKLSVSGSKCPKCGYISAPRICAETPDWVVSLSRLKRIPPLAELEQTTEQEKEPA